MSRQFLIDQLTRLNLLGPARSLRWEVSKVMGIRAGTFSQDREDVLLLEHFDLPPRGTYIDVGASHPWARSNSYLLYRRGWRGVTVEPIDWLAQLQRKHRPRDTCLNAACSATRGSSRFFLMEPHVLSTLSEPEMQRLVSRGLARLVSEERVPVLTVADITGLLLGHRLDVLFTDTEDLEIEVLNGVNWVEDRPRVVVAELGSLTSNRSAEITEFLSTKGYSLALESRHNAFYADGTHDGRID